MANLSYNRIALAGTNPSPVAAAAGGDTVPINDRGFLLVKNGSGASITVTVNTPGLTKFGIAEPDITVSVPAAGDRLIGPMRSDLYDETAGGVKVTYSAVTSVTVSALAI